jgi:hypothetical protein
MNILKNLLVSFISLFIIISCSNRGKQDKNLSFPKTFYLNLSDPVTDTMNLSEIAEKVEYIVLQTADNSMLNYFYDFSITNEFIFIRDEGCILKFDKNGKFIMSLYKVGRGPGETSTRSFTVDESGELVYVLDNFKGDVKEYDFSGNIVKVINKPINKPDQTPAAIGYYNNKLLVTTAQFPKVKYLYSLFDLANDSIMNLYKNYHSYDKSQESERPMFIYWIDKSYQLIDSGIIIKEWFCDTIFKVNKDLILEPKYIIDLGNHKLEWEGWRDHGMFNLAGGPPLGYWVQSYIETKSFLFLGLSSFKEQRLFAIINKSDNSVRILANNNFEPRTNNQVYLKNDLDNIIAFPPINTEGNLFYYDNCLYSIIEAKNFIGAYRLASERAKKSTKYLKTMAPVFNSITEFSNPVIMKVYLKKLN